MGREARQEFEQSEFLLCKLHLLALASDFHGGEVHVHIAERKCFVRFSLLCLRHQLVAFAPRGLVEPAPAVPWD